MNAWSAAIPYVFGCAGILLGAAAIGVMLLRRYLSRQ